MVINGLGLLIIGLVLFGVIKIVAYTIEIHRQNIILHARLGDESYDWIINGAAADFKTDYPRYYILKFRRLKIAVERTIKRTIKSARNSQLQIQLFGNPEC